MNLGVPIPSIDISVAMRSVSAFKDERVQAAELYKSSVKPITIKREQFIKQAHDALYFAMMISYAQGLAMLYKASSELQMEIPMHDVVKIWRGGCIIRSGLLEIFYKAYKKNKQLSNILLDKNIARLLRKKEKGLRAIIKTASQNRVSTAGLMSVLSYYDAYTTAVMPVNLIQAQRDYFGAHTYQRTDMEGTFHTEWLHA